MQEYKTQHFLMLWKESSENRMINLIVSAVARPSPTTRPTRTARSPRCPRPSWSARSCRQGRRQRRPRPARPARPARSSRWQRTAPALQVPQESQELPAAATTAHLLVSPPDIKPSTISANFHLAGLLLLLLPTSRNSFCWNF